MKFLLLEDHEGVRESLEMLLQWEGHEVVAFEHGSDALGYLSAHTVDYVLMDWNMPGISGAAFLKAARDEFLPLFTPRVAVLSGDPTIQFEAQGLGAEQFVAKPFTPDRLLEKLGLGRPDAQLNSVA